MRIRTLLVCAVFAGATHLAGQETFNKRVTISGGGPGMPGNAFYAAGEIMSEPVKGAPFSADTVSEFRQALGDGNVIERKDTGALYRDGEGRTRSETTPQTAAVDGAPVQPIVMINDPVAGAQYVLMTGERTAMKTTVTNVFDKIAGVAGGVPVGGVVIHTQSRMEAGMALPPPPTPPPAAGATIMFHRVGPEDANQENLGTRTIEGVPADGTRTTVTVPAGAVGNAKPIQVVSERWYSPLIKSVVMTRHSDPRTGDFTYQLRNIRPGEPPANLFQVPGDYTVKEGGKIETRVQRQRSPREE